MNTDQELARLHAHVDGEVQGVGFRAFVQEEAASLGLTGWVRNTYRGEVEVVAEGPRSQLESLLDKLRTGPRMAFVSEVRKEWGTASGEFRTFMVTRTV